MEIRTATMNDLDAVAAVEAECFPVAEAATKEEFAERIKYYGDHFWLMFEGDKLILKLIKATMFVVILVLLAFRAVRPAIVVMLVIPVVLPLFTAARTDFARAKNSAV